VAIAKVHAEAAFHDQEHLILIFVMMKHKLAFDFVELQILAVEFGADIRLPVFGYVGELLGNVHFMHGILRSSSLRS
jgi:hypothetical protein